MQMALPDKEGHQFWLQHRAREKRDKQKSTAAARQKKTRHTPIDLLGHHSVRLFFASYILEGVFVHVEL